MRDGDRHILKILGKPPCCDHDLLESATGLLPGRALAVCGRHKQEDRDCTEENREPVYNIRIAVHIVPPSRFQHLLRKYSAIVEEDSRGARTPTFAVRRKSPDTGAIKVDFALH